MASTSFISGVTKILDSWLNPVNQWVYGPVTKASAKTLTPEDGVKIYPQGTDGGVFIGGTGKAAGYYDDDGGDSYGTRFKPTGGDGSAGWERANQTPFLSKWFGPANTVTTLQFAVDAANGRFIDIEDIDYTIAAPITGTKDACFLGTGSITSTSNIFENNASIRLTGISVDTNANAVVLSSVSLSTVVDYEFRKVKFNGCQRVVRLEIGGTLPYTVGLDNLTVKDCKFDGGTHIAFELACVINSAYITGNKWENQGGACVFIKDAGGTGQQATKRNIRIIGNGVDTVDQGLASVAAGFYVTAEHVTVSKNQFNEIASTNASYETWGIYSKSKFVSIEGNTFTNLHGAHPTNNLFIDIKGSHVPSNDTGTNISVTGNVMHNEQSDNYYTIGCRVYGDRITVTGNLMNGVGPAFDMDGSSDSEGNYLSDNVALNPAASGNNYAVDWRMSGGKYMFQSNRFEGYIDGIRLKTNITDVELIECIDNVLLCQNTGDCFEASLATGTGQINKMLISGGRCEGQNLMRISNDVVPDFDINGVDVSGITTKTLINSSNLYLYNGSIHNLIGHTVTFSGAGTSNVFQGAFAQDTLVRFELGVLGLNSGVVGYLDEKVIETWENDGGVIAQNGVTTTVHSVKTGGGIAVALSGSTLLAQITGIAAGDHKYRVNLDVEFSNFV